MLQWESNVILGYRGQQSTLRLGFERQTLMLATLKEILLSSTWAFLFKLMMGIAIGLAFSRSGQAATRRQMGGKTEDSITYILVALAGCFMAYHLGYILGAENWRGLIFVAAFFGGVAVVWAWRARSSSFVK